MPLRISAFPKCFLEDIARGKMTVFEWVEMAGELDADGLEMYSGFLTSFEDDYLNRLADAIHEAGFAMPMFCCSPDFTNPDEDKRKLEIDREAQMIVATRKLGGPGSVCRILSGQAYPAITWEQGREWVVDAIQQLIPMAREQHVVLGMENHYKDGFWLYPEFAQSLERFTSILEAVPETQHFGVQYDPSNAIVAGDDPLVLLERVAPRVVSMHASDRYLADGGSLADLRASDGATGYSSALRHGVTGKGLNDYHAIFARLKSAGYAGWVSIEDGMNGMAEMAESLAFLRRMSEAYFPG